MRPDMFREPVTILVGLGFRPSCEVKRMHIIIFANRL